MHIHTYLPIHLPTYRQAGRPTNRQTDRPTDWRTDRRTYAHAHARMYIRTHAHACMYESISIHIHSISSHPSKPMVCLCLFVGAGNGHALGQEASVLHKWHTDHAEYCRKRGMSISPCKTLVASIKICTHQSLLGWVPYPVLLKQISSYACVILWILCIYI